MNIHSTAEPSRRPSLVVQLTAGMGNQLFAYASGRGIAHRLGADLHFRRSRSLRHGERQYGLNHFQTTVREATVGQQIRIGLSLPRPARRLFRSMGASVERQFYDLIEDRAWGYTPDIFPAGRSMFLRGFWQSPKYFLHIENEIRNELQMVDPPREIDRPLMEKIRSSESVCVHVRRGDLVSNPIYAARHYVQDAAYYAAAVERLRSDRRCDGRRLRFFVFSDDPDWPREHLRLGGDVDFQCGVPACGRADWQDFQLMRECRHFVIANSTFSWWAAWLSSRGGVRIVPRRWFKGDYAEPPPDLIPEEWVVS